jgi:N-acetylglucosamine-6-phosphate deacetylase
VTRELAEQGIIVAAGHTDAGIDILRAAVDAGLSYFTHLGNGCRSEVLRHDNIIQRALSLHDRLTFSFIADGAHIPFFALGNYLRLAALDRCVVVTDAMPAAGRGPGRYSIGGRDVEVGEDLVARAPGGRHLMGSAISMSMAFRNLTESLGLTEGEAEALTGGNPRKLLGL